MLDSIVGQINSIFTIFFKYNFDNTIPNIRRNYFLLSNLNGTLSSIKSSINVKYYMSRHRFLMKSKWLDPKCVYKYSIMTKPSKIDNN